MPTSNEFMASAQSKTYERYRLANVKSKKSKLKNYSAFVRKIREPFNAFVSALGRLNTHRNLTTNTNLNLSHVLNNADQLADTSRHDLSPHPLFLLYIIIHAYVYIIHSSPNIYNQVSNGRL